MITHFFSFDEQVDGTLIIDRVILSGFMFPMHRIQQLESEVDLFLSNVRDFSCSSSMNSNHHLQQAEYAVSQVSNSNLHPSSSSSSSSSSHYSMSSSTTKDYGNGDRVSSHSGEGDLEFETDMYLSSNQNNTTPLLYSHI